MRLGGEGWIPIDKTITGNCCNIVASENSVPFRRLDRRASSLGESDGHRTRGTVVYLSSANELPVFRFRTLTFFSVAFKRSTCSLSSPET